MFDMAEREVGMAAERRGQRKKCMLIAWMLMHEDNLEKIKTLLFSACARSEVSVFVPLV